MPLTRKQELFVREYLVDLNATQAAIRSGYSKKTARQVGSENLTKPDIQEEIKKRSSRRSEKLELSADLVVSELMKLGLANMLDYVQTTDEGRAYVDLSKLTRDQAAAIQEIVVDEYVDGKGDEARQVKRTRFKLGDKRGALELLGRRLKMWTDRHEVVGLADWEAYAERVQS